MEWTEYKDIIPRNSQYEAPRHAHSSISLIASISPPNIIPWRCEGQTHFNWIECLLFRDGRALGQNVWSIRLQKTGVRGPSHRLGWCLKVEVYRRELLRNLCDWYRQTGTHLYHQISLPNLVENLVVCSAYRLRCLNPHHGASFLPSYAHNKATVEGWRNPRNINLVVDAAGEWYWHPELRPVRFQAFRLPGVRMRLGPHAMFYPTPTAETYPLSGGHHVGNLSKRRGDTSLQVRVRTP